MSYSLAFGESDQSASLVDSVGAGMRVVLIELGAHEIHRAKTGTTYQVGPGAWNFVGTHLVGPSMQPDATALALLRVDSDQVVVVTPKRALASDLGELARVAIDSVRVGLPLMNDHGDTLVTLADSIPPQVFTTGPVKLLIYALVDGSNPEVGGPSVLCFRNTIMRLSRYCTADYTFFLQNGDLCLAYAEVGCNWGEYSVYVYNLSGEVPVLVYSNGSLGT